MPDENGVTTSTTQGPLGSPSGQLLQRGMNFLFGQSQKRGMVPPAPVPAVKPAPVTNPNIMPTIDLSSPNNILTVTDRQQGG